MQNNLKQKSKKIKEILIIAQYKRALSIAISMNPVSIQNYSVLIRTKRYFLTVNIPDEKFGTLPRFYSAFKNYTQYSINTYIKIINALPVYVHFYQWITNFNLDSIYSLFFLILTKPSFTNVKLTLISVQLIFLSYFDSK